MTVNPQRMQAITEKIVKTVQSSKKFAVVTYATGEYTIKIEVESEQPTDADYILVMQTIKFALEKWGNSKGWIENLYASLAYHWSNKDIVISETNNAGNGTTTHFYGSRPSQAF